MKGQNDMIRKITLSAIAAFALATGGAFAAGDSESHVHDFEFSFEGPFGIYDQMQLQRGLQVYTEICSACHGLRYVPLRTLGDTGGPDLPDDQVRAYAAFWEVYDSELDDFRTAEPTDHFPGSALENAPDLSLMAKARAGFHGPYGLGLSQFFNGMGGPEYIASLLTGYTGEEKEEAGTILYENTAFPGGWISMAPPLLGDDVEFEDGSSAELEEIAQDVSAFLMWAAEPKLNARKETGFVAVLFLILLSVLMYLTNKRIWAPVKHRDEVTPGE
jgi:ubiquinol-cytochrome c reductase cytochrome c1 subunit